MIVTTGNDVVGRSIADYLGIVRGIVVRLPSRRQRVRGATFAINEGGNNPYFLEVVEAGREDAHSEMLKHAESVGADAVIAIRYETTPFGTAGTSEYLAYGTAVRLVP
jgi:uncharacterized protein YbjQ (UPF0145 family)